MTVDGKQIWRQKNLDPRTFNDVKVLAGGDRYAADASYRNFAWMNLPYSGKVEKDHLIGTIGKWGPFFRIREGLMNNNDDDEMMIMIMTKMMIMIGRKR